MNHQELMKFRNDVMRFVEFNRRKRNCVNLNTHNSWQHEFLKCKICYDLQKCGKQYITEAPLSKNGIKTCQADILVLDNAIYLRRYMQKENAEVAALKNIIKETRKE